MSPPIQQRFAPSLCTNGLIALTATVCFLIFSLTFPISSLGLNEFDPPCPEINGKTALYFSVPFCVLLQPVGCSSDFSRFHFGWPSSPSNTSCLLFSAQAQTGGGRYKIISCSATIPHARGHGVVHVAAVEGTNQAPLSNRPSVGAPAFPSYSHYTAVASTCVTKNHTAAVCICQTINIEVLSSPDAIPHLVLV